MGTVRGLLLTQVRDCPAGPQQHLGQALPWQQWKGRLLRGQGRGKDGECPAWLMQHHPTHTETLQVAPADLLASPAPWPLPISVPPPLRASTGQHFLPPPTAAPIAPRLSYSQGQPGILSLLCLHSHICAKFHPCLWGHFISIRHMLGLHRKQRGPAPRPRAQGGWQQPPHPDLSEVPGSQHVSPSSPTRLAALGHEGSTPRGGGGGGG